ncbi:MAG: hypothetical protein JWM55_217 [Acidimicrobiaceae bacterium]|nr:hypothetical protein [Acidimicrobiaceae bacterium]
MITTDVINFILVPIKALLNVLPTASNLGLSGYVSTILADVPGLGWANQYFPITQAIDALTLVFSVMAIMLLVNLGLWIYHQFPTIGGGNG